ncbi:hypothetical protein [Ruegeria sp. HKCCE3926]|uniref:hypothetical protein n=1 Tax=Ruegeria sp. HKCCE3926 TaxID=2794831 RepID=UPI001AEA64CC|nr:hypothetical protein [Ruegeria sp. HKCCE3926]
MPKKDNEVPKNWDPDLLRDIIRVNGEVIKSFVSQNYGAIPIDDFACQIALPVSTMQQIRKEGKGPKTFKIGRRVYVHVKDAQEWLTELAQAAEVESDAA